MHEKLVSIGDDYWIGNEAGERSFYVDGKALLIRDTLIVKDVQGQELYKLKEKLLRIRGYAGYRGRTGKNGCSD